MSFLRGLKLSAPNSPSLPLRWLLVVPFVLQTVGLVALVGYLSYRSGQKTVEDLGYQLLEQTSIRVSDRLDSYLHASMGMAATNSLATTQGTLDLNNQNALQKQLWQQMVLNPTVPGIMFWPEQGLGLGYGRISSPGEATFATQATKRPIALNTVYLSKNSLTQRQFYLVDAQGNPQDLVLTFEGRIQALDWVQQARATKAPFWSPMHVNDVMPELQITAVAPVYDAENIFQGIFTTNYLLTEVSTFLRQLDFSPNGQVFIVEDTGALVSTSVLSEASGISVADQKPSPLMAVQSQDERTATIARKLMERLNPEGKLQAPLQLRLRAAGERQFVQITPFQDDYGLDWQVVMVIPESDLMAAIQRNRMITAVLCLLALAGAIASSWIISSRVNRPISHLNRASAALAQGDLTQHIPTDSWIAETQELAQAFNQMANQLRHLFQQQVDAEATRQSETRFQQLATAVPGMIYTYTQYPDGHHGFDYVSSVSRDIWELDPDQVMANIDRVLEQMHPDDRLAYDMAVTHSTKHLSPFTLAFRNICPSGKLKWLEASSRPIRYDNGQISWYGILIDVSDRQHREEQRQLNEKKLAASEARFQKLAETLPGALYTAIHWPDGRFQFTYCSPPTAELTEIGVKPLLADSSLFFHLLHPDDIDDFWVAYTASTQALHPFIHDWRIITPSQTTKWLRAHARPERLPTGEILWVGVAFDITPLKQAEVALRQSEARFQQIAASSPGAIYVYGCHPDGTFFFDYVSKASTDILEVTPEQVMTDANSVMALTHPDDIPGYLAAVQESKETLQPFFYEWRNFTPSGQLKWLQAHSRPERRENGDTIWYGIVIDVSDRKLAELALQENETRFQEIATASPAVIYTVVELLDGPAQFEFLSPAFEDIHEIPVEEAYRNPKLVFEQIHPEDRNAYQRAISQSLEQMQTFRHQWRIVTPSGKTKWIQASSRPSHRDNGEIVWRGVLIDITDRKSLELALQQSEAKARGILNSTVAGIASMRVFEDGTWIIDQVSAGTERLCGYTAEALTQDNQLWISLSDPEDWQAHAPQVFAHIFAGSTYAYEYRLHHKDGSLRWLAQTNNSEWDAEQHCWNLTSFSVDITDRKQAELALEAKTAELDRFFSVALDLLCIADTDGYFRRLNQQWEVALGYSLQELEGRRFLDLVHPDDVESTQQEIAVLADQQISLNFVNRYRCRDGSYRWLDWRSFPVGNLIYAAARDITERKQTEEQLRRTEQWLDQYSHQSPSLIYTLVLENDGRLWYEYLSAAVEVIYEVPLAEVLHNPQQVFNRIHPEDQAEYWRQKQQSKEKMELFRHEWRIVTPSGKLKWLQGNSQPEQRSNGTIAWHGVIQDSTERHQLDTMKEEFLSVVSHELRTPLTSIRGSLGILASGILTDEPNTAQRMMEVAVNNTDRLVRLVNDILDLERLESGKAPLVMEVCAVSELMEQAIEAVNPLASAAGISLECQPLPGSVTVAADAIIQTMTNLLSNAIKFSPPGSTVSLQAKEGESVGAWERRTVGEAELTDQLPTHPHQMIFSVIDHGRGIPPDKLELIFERFQQVDASDSRQRGGTGLGLAICKSIVKQHQGEIWAESTLGQGSTFYFTLPVS
jgi:PAS domain S-box-containing protein